ncbi:HlyD family type I secretion periplasmic adaptor subunit [Tardiphaga alba]|uniref:Membrane fusion protein (MFP) family protein n=1 Tax=Tardiphaga alba TaxID=340268 RepID=A0ABX8A8I6_9BRAD|nr:HlyD family type I secretion periplasmic adaptor subunit [Tardiphaga alba]QUS39311.1 HlyD family type I secretion periplasmic adaptor subunit [Tardiphaga alba]
MNNTEHSRPKAQTSISNPMRPAMWGGGVIVLFLTFLTIWGLTAPVSGAAVAEGSLQVKGQRQSVQHPYGGVVEKLNVVDGQEVKKGELLIQLTDHEPRARLDVLRAERITLLAQEARLVAERDHQTDPDFDKRLAVFSQHANAVQAIASERAVLGARQRQFDTQKNMLESKISQLSEQTSGLQAQVDGLKKQSELLEEEAQGARQLLASGFTPKTRVLALDRTAAQLDGERGSKQAEAASLQQAIGEAKLGLAKLERERVTEITNDLRQVSSSLAENGPKLEAASDVLNRTAITAPSSGTVVGLSVFTEGGVIQPGAKLMDVVPQDDPLIVDARLQLTDIGDVRRAQPADVRLTSVPRNERPQIRGEIMTVSADKLTDDKTGKGYYAVRVKLNDDDVRASKIALQPGMPTEIIVTTRPRTLVGYLIGPLTDEISGAFREK